MSAQIHYSHEDRCWYVPVSSEFMEELRQGIKASLQVVDDVLTVTPLEEYLCTKGHRTTLAVPGQHLLPCGCVYETATSQALEDAGLVNSNVGLPIPGVKAV